MKNLNEFTNFVKEINKENGRNYKIKTLEKYLNNETISYCLYFLYNPYITTGIAEKKFDKSVEYKGSKGYDTSNLIDVLKYIQENNTGKDEDIAVAQKFISNITDNEQIEIYKKLITKSLTLGIDSKTINKVKPKFIPTFEVQLANKYFDKPHLVNGHEFALTTKIDGGRIIALKENGEVKFFTRAGQEYEGLVDLRKELENIEEDNFCLDGEITLLDKGNLSSKDQYKQTMKITRALGEKHGIKMLVFDFLTLKEFKEQECTHIYKDRRKSLDNIFNKYELKYFNLLPILYQGTDTNKINELLTIALKNKEEGLMINFTEAYYEFKRTNNLLKVKKMNDIDLEVIGYEEGSGAMAGTLGSLIVEYKGNKVYVGSGFSKEQREEIWKHPNDYIGITISIQYFEETTNDQGGISLRFPVFLDFRYDK